MPCDTKRRGLFPGSCLLAVLWAAPLAAETDLSRRIDEILDESYAADAPGAAVLVVDDGEVVYRGARGMAHLELGVPLEPDMIFRLGSITKQFTAAAILLLEEDGKLSTSDAITDHLPDYPVHGHTLTVEHLLTHTSGIFNYTAIPGYLDHKIRRDLSTEELVDEFKTQEMDFAPGRQWSYSNSGYVLLGAILEEASEMSWADFVRERIFEPLGMKNSHCGGHQLIPRRVAGYAPDGDGGWVNAPYLSMTQPHAAGALLSNVDDLARWDAALYSGELLGEASRRRMFTDYALADGKPSGYGYGFAIGTFRGTPSISHGGGIFGFRTYALRLPEEKVYVAVLSNGSTTSPTSVAQEIAALAIGRPFPEWSKVEVTPEVLERYVGVYRIDGDTTRVVTVEDGKLYTQRSGGQRLEALPHSETGFFYEDSFTHFELVLDDGGAVTHMLMYPNGGDEPEKAEKTDEPVPTLEAAEVDPAIYDRYVGEYEVRPSFAITITREGDRLFSQATGQAKFEIFPESETVFFLKVVDARVHFHDVIDGRARKLVIHQGGREVPAERVD